MITSKLSQKKKNLQLTNISIGEDKENYPGIYDNCLGFPSESYSRTKSQLRSGFKEESKREFGKDITHYFANPNEISYSRPKISQEAYDSKLNITICPSGQQIITPQSNSSNSKFFFKKERVGKSKVSKQSTFQTMKFIPNHPNTSKNKDSININNFLNGNPLHGEKNEKINNYCRQRKNYSSINLDYPQTVKNSSSSKFNFKQNAKEKEEKAQQELMGIKLNNQKNEKKTDLHSNYDNNLPTYQVFKKKRQSSAKPKSVFITHDLYSENPIKNKLQIKPTINTNPPCEITNVILNNWANKENVEINKIRDFQQNNVDSENEMHVEVCPISEITTGTNSKQSKMSLIECDIHNIENSQEKENHITDEQIFKEEENITQLQVKNSYCNPDKLQSSNNECALNPLGAANHNDDNKVLEIEDVKPNTYKEKFQSNQVKPLLDIFQNIPEFMKEQLEEIYTNLLEEERSINRSFGYFQRQPDINEQMRAILIDWLVEVHLKFSLRDETLFMTTNIIDLYLNKKTVSRSNLQLLGVGALMISCKQEEILTPHVKDFVYITDKAYTKEQVLSIEKEILETLNYDILSPSSLRFYEIISYFMKLNKKQFMLGRYFLEISLIDYRMNKYCPSLVACTCAYITMKYYNLADYQTVYSPIFLGTTPINYLKECAREICQLVDNLNSTNLTALRRKFAKDEFCNVSSVTFG